MAKNAGSHLSNGARLVVDGTEVFPLVRKGPKWVVTANARSATSGKSVREVFAEGTHSIVAVNPDGERSAAAVLP